MKFELRICVNGNEWLGAFLTNCKVSLTRVDLREKKEDTFERY